MSAEGKRIALLERALRFYAKGDNWLEIPADTGTVMDWIIDCPSDFNPWEPAERALNGTEPFAARPVPQEQGQQGDRPLVSDECPQHGFYMHGYVCPVCGYPLAARSPSRTERGEN